MLTAATIHASLPSDPLATPPAPRAMGARASSGATADRSIRRFLIRAAQIFAASLALLLFAAAVVFCFVTGEVGSPF